MLLSYICIIVMLSAREAACSQRAEESGKKLKRSTARGYAERCIAKASRLSARPFVRLWRWVIVICDHIRWNS